MTTIHLSDEVRDALHSHRPVVALESTIIAHGFPPPRNLEVAHRFEQKVRDAGAVPATIAVIAGVPTVGLSESELTRIAGGDVEKLSARDLPIAIARRLTGATTVAATAALAAQAGIAVFATGGLGGVHRGAAETFDESADLVTMSRLPITIVSAGVKSILDVPATLERLETLGITVVGFRTDQFPGFYLADSGYPVGWRVESAAEVAAIMTAADGLDTRGAILVANPVPAEAEMDRELHDGVLTEALAAAGKAQIHGKAVTPFVLEYFHSHTGGVSMDVNETLVLSNIEVAAAIAADHAG